MKIVCWLNNKCMEVKEIKKKEENPLNKVLENVKKDSQGKPAFNMQEILERFRQKIKERQSGTTVEKKV